MLQMSSWMLICTTVCTHWPLHLLPPVSQGGAFRQLHASSSSLSQTSGRDSLSFSPSPLWTSGCTLSHFKITPFRLTSLHCKRSEGEMGFWGAGRGSEQRKNILCQWSAALVSSCWAQTACWMVSRTTQSEGSDWLLCQLGDGLEGHLMVTAQSGKDSRFQECPASPKKKWPMDKLASDASMPDRWVLCLSFDLQLILKLRIS